MLQCPICQSLVNQPVIYKTCLHRFCSECIESYNRLGKKECPLCRAAIGNRRQLRPDKNIASMIDILRGSFEQMEQQQQLENMMIKQRVIEQQK